MQDGVVPGHSRRCTDGLAMVQRRGVSPATAGCALPAGGQGDVEATALRGAGFSLSSATTRAPGPSTTSSCSIETFSWRRCWKMAPGSAGSSAPRAPTGPMLGPVIQCRVVRSLLPRRPQKRSPLFSGTGTTSRRAAGRSMTWGELLTLTAPSQSC